MSQFPMAHRSRPLLLSTLALVLVSVVSPGCERVEESVQQAMEPGPTTKKLLHCFEPLSGAGAEDKTEEIPDLDTRRRIAARRCSPLFKKSRCSDAIAALADSPSADTASPDSLRVCAETYCDTIEPLPGEEKIAVCDENLATSVLYSAGFRTERTHFLLSILRSDWQIAPLPPRIRRKLLSVDETNHAAYELERTFDLYRELHGAHDLSDPQRAAVGVAILLATLTFSTPP